MTRAFLLAAAASPDNLCPVTQPGAAGIQAAIDACAAKGGGVAYVPPGEHVSGPLWMKDNVELRLEAGAIVRLSHERRRLAAGVRARS